MDLEDPQDPFVAEGWLCTVSGERFTVVARSRPAGAADGDLQGEAVAGEAVVDPTLADPELPSPVGEAMADVVEDLEGMQAKPELEAAEGKPGKPEL